MTMEQEACRFLRLNDEWLVALEEVRQLDGFQDFLRPSRLSTLQDAAASGPVVVLNASGKGCGALVITLTGVKYVHLSDISLSEAHILVQLIRAAITSNGRNPPLAEADCVQIEGLLEKVPVFSNTLSFLRQSVEARHVGRTFDTKILPEDIFQFVLGILWKCVIEPVIRLLDLKVSYYF